MKRTLLIDADIVCYKFASATEEVFYFDGKDKPPVVEHDTEEACAGAVSYIEQLKNQLGADHIVVCLTDRGNEYRKDFWPDYKGNRKGRKPTDLFNVQDHLAKVFETYKRPRLEADDCMGILSTHPTLIVGEKIIVSEDKDMKCVPGLLFNPAKDDEPYRISQLQANRWHMVQTIIGDTTDNYPGAEGIGPSSPEVEGVMGSKTVEEMWQHVMAAFKRAEHKAVARELGIPAKKFSPVLDLAAVTEKAIVQARCARILRASDWNFKEKRPVLWCAPR